MVTVPIHSASQFRRTTDTEPVPEEMRPVNDLEIKSGHIAVEVLPVRFGQTYEGFVFTYTGLHQNPGWYADMWGVPFPNVYEAVGAAFCVDWIVEEWPSR